MKDFLLECILPIIVSYVLVFLFIVSAPLWLPFVVSP